MGWIELAGGLGWAVMGLLCGLKPASTARVYRLRAGIGVGVLALCGLLTVGLVLSSLPAAQARIAVICLWTACGIGMGITYIDTMNVFFEEPEVDDSITIEQMASASVMVESLSSAIFIPLTTSLAAFAFQKKVVGQVGQPPHVAHSGSLFYGAAWGLVAVLAVIAWLYLHRSGPRAREKTVA